MLRAGIVGLPNVGKSTLFNAVTRTRKAEAANYPFCTIDPNVGIVTVPDARLASLKRIAKTNVVIPAAIEFVDIAGLVKGASQGEGLGNKFLTPHPRSRRRSSRSSAASKTRTSITSSGTIDPVRDIEMINTELDARRPRGRAEAARAARQGRQARRQGGRRRGRGARQRSKRRSTPASRRSRSKLTPEERALSRAVFSCSSDKPTIFACNVKEGDLATADTNPYVHEGPRIRARRTSPAKRS